MKKSAQTASTQSFTQIADIRDDIVLLEGNNACIILSIASVNFSLLAGAEQDAKVAAYAALLNSLSFPVQILVRSKPAEIEPYIASLTQMIQETKNEKLKIYMAKYKEYVQSLVSTTTILDKQFYIVISYSSLEAGPTITLHSGSDAKEAFFTAAQASLETKADELLSQIHRLSLKAEVLKKESLIKLFYSIYNQGELLPLSTQDLQNAVVKGV